jgi:hypothetical protein
MKNNRGGAPHQVHLPAKNNAEQHKNGCPAVMNLILARRRRSVKFWRNAFRVGDNIEFTYVYPLKPGRSQARMWRGPVERQRDPVHFTGRQG